MNTSIRWGFNPKALLPFFLLLIGLVPAAGSLSAQAVIEPNSGKWTLAAGSGISLPLKGFSQYQAPSSGSAGMGSDVNLRASFAAIKFLSLHLNAEAGMQSVNALRLAEGIWEENKAATSVSIEAGPYKLGTLMLGAELHSSRAKRLSVSAGISGGLLVLESPAVYREIALPSPVHQHISPAMGSGFCIQPELGIDLKLTGALSLGVYGQYLDGAAPLAFRTEENDNLFTVNQSVQSLRIGCRLLFRL